LELLALEYVAITD